MPYYLEQRLRHLRSLAGRIGEAVYTPLADLNVVAFHTKEPVPYAERESGTRLELKPGDKWGDLFDCAWFHFTGGVPAEAKGQEVVLLIDVNGEGLVVDADGNPVQGLTNVSSGFDFSLGAPGKRVVPFAQAAQGGEAVDLWVDAGCNDLFGNLCGNGTLKEARIAVCHPELKALFYDMAVLHELMNLLPQESARRQQIFAALDAAAGELSAFTDEEAARARAHLAPALAKQGGDPSLKLSAIGHAHIDLAWLWPLRETFRKGARTFSTVMRFMERYPDYHFGASQPQLFAWMKDYYPTLYAEMKQRAAEGRFEAQGAMWVEADTNVPSGESLVRQLLHGKRFFRAEFGLDPRVLWLPDVFGYSAALPQLLRKAGVPWFMTQKLSWNWVNAFPHQTFRWQGLDGSSVLAHMLPEETYNSSAMPRALHKTETNFRDKIVSDEALLLFGIGDGGGGPGEEHLEALARERNLAGLPPVVQEPAETFFERLDQNVGELSTWAGELYLERHQGTYTTQARNKRYNRKMELALREAEWAAAQALQLTGTPYPAAELEAIWKEVLLYQFHDILPGSSIARVYEESLARYAALLAETQALTEAAEQALAAQVDTSAAAQPAVVANSLSWPRNEWLELGGAWREVEVPAMGHTVVDLATPAGAVPTVEAAPDRLENDLLRVTFAADGSLASVWDKAAGREALAGPGNRLALYQDVDDAWDIPMDYARRAPEHFALQSAEARVDGPRAILRQVYTYGTSTLTQEVVLTAGSPRLDFVTEIDWRESRKMLRTSFPAAIHATEVSCEIQFGHVRRPTHRNTSWDLARFEICAHKWLDLSDRGYGLALLNDGKYGHKAEGNVLDLNLLRSTNHPGKDADKAVHQVTYSLLPHSGDAVAAQVAKTGYELNVPLRVTETAPHAGALPATASWLSVEGGSVVIDTVKRAEDGDELIVRLYEADGASTRAAIAVALPVSAVDEVDLMEEHPTPVAPTDGQVMMEFGPFEVKTLRLRK